MQPKPLYQEKEAFQEAERRIWRARRSGATTLDLDRLGLEQLPNTIDQLTNLKFLILSNNKLSSLPNAVSQLRQLRILSLSNNLFTELQETISLLARLESLNLAFNHLIRLPDTIGLLTKLERLDLSANELVELSATIGQLEQLREFDLSRNQLSQLPETIGQLRKLALLNLNGNRLKEMPVSITRLKRLQKVSLANNELSTLPDSIRELTNVRTLYLQGNRLTALPRGFVGLTSLQGLTLGVEGIGNPLAILPDQIRDLKELVALMASNCQLTSLPNWIAEMESLRVLILKNNNLAPDLAAAYKQGLDAVKEYLRAKSQASIILNEAKLILIGEGEVGKSCLLGALRGDEFVEGKPTTHGIEIKQVHVTDPISGKDIILNAWDFGGQPIYRPTHQLFFSAPAVYLVVWKPREGVHQGFVKDWIRLIKHREPDAKILVVATHGGPDQRQPDINHQEVYDLFGHETIHGFYHIDSKPDKQGNRRGIADLKQAIARVAAALPEMGRSVPARWQQVRETLQKKGEAYLTRKEICAVCREHSMEDEEAQLFIAISHRLGHLISYEHDPLLHDIVIIKPDWLATAMSLVLDDKQTREAHGLISFNHLSYLWNNPTREDGISYPTALHPIFLRLMERFDLSYQVAEPPHGPHPQQTSLIAQLVPDNRPVLTTVWPAERADRDSQQSQICRIVEKEKGHSAPAEGLFYQLIVRLHKFSLGKDDYNHSVHWQHGLVLDDDYNGRALLEHTGNDIRITVRAPYPEFFLSHLTYEVKWLVENFWQGLRCDVMVPCVEPCGRNKPGTGLYDVRNLIESKQEGYPKFPCPVCNKWQEIDSLLRNAPAARSVTTETLFAELEDTKLSLDMLRTLLITHHRSSEHQLDVGTQRILSKVDDVYEGLLRTLTDEAKDGPRLFSLEPVDPGFLKIKTWTKQKFRLTLWCEHSRLPLPALNGKDDKRGVYELDFPREWFVKAAPYLKLIAGTLSLVLPAASAATKLMLDDTAYKAIEKQLEFGQKSLEAVAKATDLDLGREMESEGWGRSIDVSTLEAKGSTRAQGAILRQLQALLKEKDPGFGGLVRVQNKRQEFLWVHPEFASEY